VEELQPMSIINGRKRFLLACG